jgi:hypothetical protein
VRDRLGVTVRGPVGEAGPRLCQVVAAESERRAALLARDEPTHVEAFLAQVALDGERAPEDLAVERAGEAAVSRDRHDRGRALVFAPLEQRDRAHRSGRPRDAAHQLEHAVGVGPHRLDPLLGAAQLRRGDELHGPRDLLRVGDRPDAALGVLNRRH